MAEKRSLLISYRDISLVNSFRTDLNLTASKFCLWVKMFAKIVFAFRRTEWNFQSILCGTVHISPQAEKSYLTSSRLCVRYENCHLFKSWITLSTKLTHYRLDNSVGFDSAYPIHSDLSSGSHYSTIEKLVPDHKTPSSIAYTQEAQVWAGLLSGMVGDLAIKKNNNEIGKKQRTVDYNEKVSHPIF